MKKKILLITDRNLVSVSGEWKLVSERARAIWLNYKVKTFVLALTKKSRFYSGLRAPTVNGIEIKYFSYGNIFEFFLSFIKIFIVSLKKILNNEISTFILSGAISYLYWPFIIIFKKPIIIDIHGCLEEWIEYPKNSFPLSKIMKYIYIVVKFIEGLIIRYSNAVIVVSNPLKTYINNRVYNSRVYVIPCGSVMMIDENEYLRERYYWRKKLSIKNEFVFVYFGGLSKWQLLDKTCEFVNDLKTYIPNIKLILITLSKRRSYILAKRAGLRDDELINLELLPEEAEKLLCACDVGLLLRENNLTNKMAFPNKFTDYVKGRLVIILSKSLEYPYEIVNKYKIGVGVDLNNLSYKDIYNQVLQILDVKYFNFNEYNKRFLKAFNEHLDLRERIKPLKMFLIN